MTPSNSVTSLPSASKDYSIAKSLATTKYTIGSVEQSEKDIASTSSKTAALSIPAPAKVENKPAAQLKTAAPETNKSPVKATPAPASKTDTVAKNKLAPAKNVASTKNPLDTSPVVDPKPTKKAEKNAAGTPSKATGKKAANPVDASQPSLPSRIGTAVKGKASRIKQKAAEVAQKTKQSIIEGATTVMSTDAQEKASANNVADWTRYGHNVTSSPESTKLQDNESTIAYGKRLFTEYSATAADAGQVRKIGATVKGAILTALAIPFKASGEVGNAVFRFTNNLSREFGRFGSRIATGLGFAARAITFVALMLIGIAVSGLAIIVGAISAVVVTAISVAAIIIGIPVFILKGDTIYLAVKSQEQGKELKAIKEAIVPKKSEDKKEETAPVIETVVAQPKVEQTSVVETVADQPKTTPVEESKEKFTKGNILKWLGDFAGGASLTVNY